jgi:hypothetical protein
VAGVGLARVRMTYRIWLASCVVVGKSDPASYRVSGSARVRASYMRMVVSLGLGNVGVM